MSFSDAVTTCFSKYATFSGRARRSEFWWFFLAYYGALIVAGLLDYATRSSVPGALVMLALILPTLAVTIRRLHDTTRSGWWYFISFVPLVGGLVILVFVCQDTSPGENIYGPSPKLSPALV